MADDVLQAQLAETPRTAAFLSPSERQWLQDRQDAARSAVQEKGSDPRALGALQRHLFANSLCVRFYVTRPAWMQLVDKLVRSSRRG